MKTTVLHRLPPGRRVSLIDRNNECNPASHIELKTAFDKATYDLSGILTLFKGTLGRYCLICL